MSSFVMFTHTRQTCVICRLFTDVNTVCVCVIGSLPSQRSFCFRHLRWDLLRIPFYPLLVTFCSNHWCCQVLDKEKRGYVEAEELTKLLTQEGKEEASNLRCSWTYPQGNLRPLWPGDPFSQEEVDEMLTALPDDKRIYYTDYITQLTFDPDS